MRFRAFVSGLMLLLATTSIALATEADSRSRKTKIVDLEVQKDGDRLDVSYRVRNGFTPELVEKIQAGIPVTFSHRVEVTVKHFLPLWPSRTVAGASVETTVVYDSLTHRFELSRVTETFSKGQPKVEPRERQESTVAEAQMRAWMTEMTEIPSLDLSAIPDDTAARVRVESTLGRRWIVLVPTRRTVNAERKLDR